VPAPLPCTQSPESDKMPTHPLRTATIAAALTIALASCGTHQTAAPVVEHPAPTVRPASVPTTTQPASTVPSTTSTTTTEPPTTVPIITTPDVAAGSTEVAVLNGDTPGSATPGGPVIQTVPGTWYSAVSSLPVIAQAPGWLQVRLAQRPNESTAWIPASAAQLVVTPDKVVVDLATRHLELFVNDVMTQDFPAGIGTPSSPTTPGNFFVALFAAAPNAGYGPFVLVTSAHSDAITDWSGSGDAIIAIHGPISSTADTEIGTTGAANSNGCVRLHDADLALLRDVPAGSPVTIVS
jgi:L,D-transpeptidase catalytic domain